MSGFWLWISILTVDEVLGLFSEYRFRLVRSWASQPVQEASLAVYGVISVSRRSMERNFVFLY